MEEPKCVAGCKHFTGGEIKHHKDCPHYAESMSKMYDDLKSEVKKLRLANVRLPLPVRFATWLDKNTYPAGDGKYYHREYLIKGKEYKVEYSLMDLYNRYIEEGNEA